MPTSSRGLGFFALLIIYIAATLLGIVTFGVFSGWGLYPRMLSADVAATLFVWLTGLLVKNASVYDPYWSVAPVLMLILGALYLGAVNAGTLLVIAVVALWGVRLTVHWSTTFENLKVQDWRYTMLRNAHPRLWFIINLFGINLFPTIVVFLVLAPAFQFMLNFESFGPGTVVGALVSLAAVALQLVSDAQMRLFRRKLENRGHVNRTGLWRYSRHPNYLGEILMWWGVCLTALSAPGASGLYITGALVNTLMFVFISIPMLERRQLRGKQEYAAYKAETGMLLPNPWKSKGRKERAADL